MQATIAPPSEKLTVSTKLAYGAGDFGPAVATALMSFFLLIFLTDVAGVSPGAAGTILLLTKIWDAVNDPFMGWLSDRTRTRWGRRRPWLLWGAVPFGLSFFLLWLVPNFGETGRFVYYLIVLLFLDTAFTLVNVPYTALTPELTRDYDERTSLTSYRFAFSIAGALIAAVVHPLIVAQFGADVQRGYAVSAAIWGVVCTIPFLVAFAGTFERPDSQRESEAEDSLLEQVRIAFGNRPYRFVIALYLLSWLVVQLVATVMIYYLTYYMGMADQIPGVLLAVQGSTFLWLFVWSALSRRMEKRTVFLVGGSFWMLVQMGLYFVGPTQQILVYVLAALAGVGVATAYLIPWSMMPDIIEFDELETGQRREGVFYGFMVLLQKLGLALGLFLVAQALEWSGYVPNQPVQPAGAIDAIRFFMGPVPAAILVVALIVAYFYPITRAKHAEVRAALAVRQGEASV